MVNRQTIRRVFSSLRAVLLVCAVVVAGTLAHGQQSVGAGGSGSSSSAGVGTGTVLGDVLGQQPGAGQSCPAGGHTPGEPGCAGAGNPLNAMTGNKYQREADMAALPGVLGLELVRHYNSELSTWWRGLGASSSAVGRGWRLGYDALLHLPAGPKGKRLTPGELAGLGDQGNQGGAATVHYQSGDGTRIALAPVGSAPGGVAEWAGSGTPWRLRVEPAQSASPYVLSDGKGLQRHFDAQGRQVRIQAATGHAVQIERDGHGRITRVTDPQGRQMVLHYPEAVAAAGQSGKGRPRVVRQASHIDTPLGRYSYHYGSEHAAPASHDSLPAGALITLAQQQAQASTLMRVELPDGSQRHYHHEDRRQPSLLTGLSVRAGTGAGADAPLVRQASWAYDHLGRAIRSVKGPIPAEGRRGMQEVSLQFLGPQGSQRRDGSGVSILTNSLGEQTRYEYEMLGGQRQLTLVQGAGCGSCGPANVRYGHDSLGRQVSITELSPVRVDAHGQVQGRAQALHSQSLKLDPQGRVLRIERTIYDNQGHAVRTEQIERRDYADGRWPYQPTLIARPSVVEGQERRIELRYNAAGQVEQVKESGYSPLDEAGQISANSVNSATAIERTSTYGYERIGGHSVLVQADGPLANGPSNSPADSDITRIEWDEGGARVLAITHPMGLTERLEYESAGANPSARLSARTDVLGVRTELAWAAHAMRVERVRRAGVQVDLGYDAQGRVLSYRRNDGARISVAYDEASGTIRHTLPDGETREVRRDSEGRATASQWLDTQGQVLVGGAQIDWGSQDAQGLREIRITEASGVLSTLRHNPLQATIHSERGQGEGRLSHSERFDAARHLLQIQRNEAATQLQGSAQEAQRSLELPHGATHRQWKDDFGRTVRIEHPDSGTHRAAWDEADRQTARWDSSRHSSARYDALGRLIQLRHANSDGPGIESASAVVKAIVRAEEETHWHYEGALLKRQSSTRQDRHFAYDANGRLIQERLSLRRQGTQASQAPSEWLPELITRYQRDELGRITHIRLPEGATLGQRYNGQGRIEAVSLQEPASAWWHQAIRWVWAEQGTRELITEIEHSASRGLRGYRHANGSQATSVHDRAGRLTRWSDGPQTSELGYNEHAQLANLKTAAPQRVGAGPSTSRQQSLGYDAFGRLRQVQEGASSQGFEYDRNGNRTGQSSETLGRLSFALAQRSDRLLAVQDEQGRAQRSYRYNEAGEPVRIETDAHTRTLHYDALGQIGAVEQDGKLLAHYAYNGARQRVAKTVRAESEQSATTTYYTWHKGLLDAELDSEGRVQRRYIYLNLRAVALLEYGYDKNEAHSTPQSTQRFAIHGDHLGTPQAITDDKQRVVWLASYDVFGRASAQGLPRSQVTAHNRSGQGRSWIGIAQASTPDKPFEFHLRFAGQYEDAETGWHYNWHRYYEPQTGRYLTPDPIGLRGGDNAYGYAEGDPLGAVDPWGLYTVYWGGAGLDGDYIADQMRALREAGVENVHRGTGSGGRPPYGIGLDANAVINLRTYPPRYGFITPRAPYAGDPCAQMLREGEQINYIGYSYGSLLAAHTAMHYANQGRVIDNLVLIGSPIDGSFLSALRNHQNIRNVTVIDLTANGDRIYAGMSELELVQAVPNLISDVGSGRGHFYYGDTSDPQIGENRRNDLASQLYAEGLR